MSHTIWLFLHEVKARTSSLPFPAQIFILDSFFVALRLKVCMCFSIFKTLKDILLVHFINDHLCSLHWGCCKRSWILTSFLNPIHTFYCVYVIKFNVQCSDGSLFNDNSWKKVPGLPGINIVVV